MAGHRKGNRSSEECTIAVRITPRSSRTSATLGEGDTFLIRLTAPPTGGAANDQLVRYLSRALGLPKSNLHIISGARSRNKRVRITGMNAPLVQKRLAES